MFISSLQPFTGLRCEPRNSFRGGRATKQKALQGWRLCPSPIRKQHLGGCLPLVGLCVEITLMHQRLFSPILFSPIAKRGTGSVGWESCIV